MSTIRADDGTPSPPLLRVLILEDSPGDAKLAASVLEGGGYSVQSEVTDSLEYFQEYLERDAYDVILADFNLRNWTAFDALNILKQSGKDIPLVVVTGSLGDEAAVECIKQGAADFVLKDRPARLPVAVKRALDDRRLRTENMRAFETVTRLATIVESSDDAIFSATPEGLITTWNAAAERMYGYTGEEIEGRHFSIFIPEDQRRDVPAIVEELARGEAVKNHEQVNIRKDGSRFHVSLTLSPCKDDAGLVTGVSAIVRDITESKQAERALQESEERFRTLTEKAPVAIGIGRNGLNIYANQKLLEMFGCHNLSEIVGRPISELWAPAYRAMIEEHARERMLGLPAPMTYEGVGQRRDSSQFLVQVNVTMVALPDGPATLAFLTDITERKQAEEMVKASEERFRKAFMTGADAFYIATLDDGKILEVNDRFEDVFGHSRDEAIGKTSLQLDLYANPLDRERFVSEMRAVGYARNLELKAKKKGGDLITVLLSANLLRESEDRTILGVIRDITERKRVEEALRQSEEKYRSLVSNIPDVSWTLDANQRFTYISSNIESLTGFSPDEVYQQGAHLYLSSLHPDDVHKVREAFRGLFVEGRPFDVEVRAKCKDGEWKWLQHRALATYEKNGIQFADGLLSDITERKRAEEALRQSEAKLREALLAAQMGAWEWTQATDTAIWDENLYRIAGRDPELPASSYQEHPKIYTPESWERLKAAVENSLATGAPYELDLEMVRPDGSKRWLITRGEPVRDASGHITGLRGTVQDITERKRTEESLRESEARLEEAEHLAHIGSSSWDVATDTTTWSDELYRIMGMDPGRPAPTHQERAALYAPESWARLESAVQRALATGEPYDMELEVVRPDGTRRQVHARGAAVSGGDDGRIVRLYGTLQDITERRRTEQALRESDQRYRDFMEHSTEGVWRLELEQPIPIDLLEDEILERCLEYGYIAECNQAHARILGFSTPKEVIGRRLRDLVLPSDQERLETFRSIARSRFGGRPVEFRGRDRSGNIRHLSRTEIPIIQNGMLERVWGITRDITEQKAAEKAVLEAESQYREIFEGAMEGIYRTSLEGKSLAANPALAKILGFDSAPQVVSAINDSAHQVWLDPNERSRFTALVQERGAVQAYVCQWKRQDGSVIWVSLDSRVVRDVDGRTLFFEGFVQDITERKRAEEALRESQALNNAILESTSDMIWTVDSEGFRLLTFNRSLADYFLRWCGIRLQVGTGPEDHFPTEELVNRWRGFYERALAEGSYVTDYNVAAGSNFLQLTFNLLHRDGEVFAISVFGKNITERKRAEEALRESEKKYRQLHESMMDGFVRLDMDGRIVEANDAFCGIVGYTPEELLRLTRNDLTLEKWHAADVDILENQVFARGYSEIYVKEYRRKDGIVIPVELRTYLMLDESGDPSGMWSIVRDITERRWAEEMLREYEKVVEGSSDIIAVIDREYRYLIANAAFLERRGLKGTDVVGSSIPDLVGKEFFETVIKKKLDECFQGNVVRYEMKSQYPMLGERDMLASYFPIEGPNGVNQAACVLQDITERKRAERELERVNRALRTISDCNEALVRAGEESQLLEDVCGILVREGGYLMAWVGFGEHDEGKTVCPVAHAGLEGGYLQSVRITWADTDRGRGPTGTAIRTGKPVIAREMQSDPSLVPWREEAIKRGYASSIALPILLDGQVLGALTIYAEEPDAFDSEELQLLTELSDDLAYGIQTLRTRAERERAEEALRESEGKYRSLVSNIPDVVWTLDAEFRFVFISKTIEKMSGYSADDVYQKGADLYLASVHPDDVHKVKDGLRALFAEGRPYDVECRVQRKTGEWVWVHDRAHTTYEKNGIRYADGLLSDITERKRAEEEILFKTALLEAESETTIDGILVVDMSGQILLANRNFAKMWNVPEETLRAKDDKKVLAEGLSQIKDPGAFLERVNHLYAHETEKSRDEVEFKDGRVIDRYSSPLQDYTGKIHGRIWYFRDITERKRAEEASRKSEERFRLFMNNSPTVAWMKDEQGHYVYISETFQKRLGVRQEDWVGKTDFEVYPRAVAELFSKNDQTALAAGHSIEITEESISPGGEHCWWLSYKFPFQDASGQNFVAGIGMDVTKQKSAELALLESEERFRSLVENATVGIYRTTPQGRILMANPTLVRMLGYKDFKELAARNLEEDGFEPDYPRKLFRARMEQDGEVRGLEEEWAKQDGSLIYVRESARAIRGEDGKILYYDGIVEDITERKRAEAERARLVTAIEQSAEAVVITDTNGNIEYVNTAFTGITGYSRKEVLGQNPRILKSGKQDPSMYEQLWKTILNGHIWQGELINRRKDGSLYAEQMSITPMRGERGEVTHFIATKQDITARKQLEQQFNQAQKMEAVGRLAGGVAHDFNNLLTIINGYAELLTEQVPPEDPRRGHLAEILMAGERAASLPRQLLAFSRRQVMEPKVLDLNSILANTEKMLRRLIGEDVELVATLNPGLRSVKVDPGQIEQVIMNLAVNARDAMPEGGKFLIETSNVDVDKDYANSHPSFKPGKYVMVAVSDTGCGMDKETQAHIFEPFFTTKEKGRGTGLGLATVYGIIKQSGGFIWVYSEPGHGSTFKIYFPCAEESVPLVEPAKVPAEMAKVSETVLVVEDEVGVRSLVGETLRSRGYTVLVAEGAAQALKIAAQHTKPIHLLLTDVVMPEINGKELAKRLSNLHPETKVLYMSGYTDDAIVRRGILAGNMAFLQKPFAPDALARKVREVLKMRPGTQE